MHNIFLILALTSPLYFLKTAEAASKYEKIKTMYIQATAPNSEAFVLKRAVEVGACAEFARLNPDQSKPQSLVVVTHKIRGGGPEFPDQILKGLGFGNAAEDPEKFFKNYKKHLSSSEFSIQYEYQYFESICYDYPDGSSHCTGSYDITIAANAQFRVFKDYLVYEKSPDIYGYCWSRN